MFVVNSVWSWGWSAPVLRSRIPLSNSMTVSSVLDSMPSYTGRTLDTYRKQAEALLSPIRLAAISEYMWPLSISADRRSQALPLNL